MRDVRVNADPATNSLIVTAPEEAMGLVAALIQRLDQPAPAEAQLKVFQLENGNASDVRTMLEEMFPADTQQGQAGFPGAAATGDTTLVPLRFSVDVRTNSIIASGTPSDLRVVNAIIVVLDSSDVRQRQNLVYRLRYTQAADVAAAIQQFLDAEQQRTQQQIQQLVQATQVGLSPFEQIEREVVVVAEPLSNTLIISATPRFYDQIVEIVREIDSIPPMVMIQVLIAQVSYEHQEQFGVELGIQDSLLFDREDLLVDPPGRSVLGIPFFIDQNAITTGQNVAAQGLTDLSLGRQNTEFGFGGLVIAAGSESVNILIRALEQRARVDLLARPQIMTLDNQPSRIQLGQEVRLPSATSVTEAGITNLTTEERQVGVILDVLPRISPDGTVAILVSAERSRLGPEAQGTAIGFDQDGNVIRTPNVDLATAFTTISVRSGQTAVFSGLLTKDTIMITRGVPILSDLPVIGNAFRFDSADTSETELLIIMTPHVIRTPEDMHRINAIESSRMSWCLADVVRLHADPGLVGDESNWHGSDIMTIYPDGEPVELEPSSTESRAKSTDTSSVSRWRRLLATMRPQAKRAALPRGAAGHDLQENNWQANEMGSGEESIADSDRSLMGLGPAEGLPPAVNRVEPTAYPPLAPADRPKRLPGTR
jgi:type II secretion system protein D